MKGDDMYFILTRLGIEGRWEVSTVNLQNSFKKLDRYATLCKLHGEANVQLVETRSVISEPKYIFDSGQKQNNPIRVVFENGTTTREVMPCTK